MEGRSVPEDVSENRPLLVGVIKRRVAVVLLARRRGLRERAGGI